MKWQPLPGWWIAPALVLFLLGGGLFVRWALS